MDTESVICLTFFEVAAVGSLQGDSDCVCCILFCELSFTNSLGVTNLVYSFLSLTAACLFVVFQPYLYCLILLLFILDKSFVFLKSNVYNVILVCFDRDVLSSCFDTDSSCSWTSWWIILQSRKLKVFTVYALCCDLILDHIPFVNC